MPNAYLDENNKRHPAEMGAPEVTKFLTHLAVNHHVAASTHECQSWAWRVRGSDSGIAG